HRCADAIYRAARTGTCDRSRAGAARPTRTATHAAPPAAPDALASLAPRADIACGELRHFIGLRMRRIDESECGGARRLESRPQAPDFFPPCHGEEVAVGVPSFIPHAALA